MAVQPQTPYQEDIANGVTTVFPLEFDCENKDHLIVLIDDVEADSLTWALANKQVTFTIPPELNKKITFQRNTPFKRERNYQSYDNSLRPDPLNKDFDWIWLKAQELGVSDWLLSNKIQKFRDDVNLTALEETLEQAKAIRDETADSVIEVQSNVAQSQTLLTNTTTKANQAQSSATSANTANASAQQAAANVSTAESNVYTALDAQKQEVQASLTAIAGGHKAYQTLAAAQAAQASFPVSSIVEVTNDGANNGIYQWNGTTLTKSAYDPLTQAKTYADANAMFKPVPIVSAIDFNTLKTYGLYYFFSGATFDASTNKPTGISNQWAYMIVMPVSASVVGQYVWCLNSLKMAFRFCNASNVWSIWSIFSDDVSLTSIIKTSVNVDRDATFDARALSSVNPVFESLSKNFFDKNMPMLINYRITGTGILEYHLNSVTTLPVYVKGQTSITVSGLTASAAAYRAYRFLDKDKNWISNAPIRLNTTGKVISVPANAVWFQICLKDGFDTWALNVDTIQVEQGTVASSYVAYSKGNLKSIYGADIASSSQSGQKASKAYGAKYLLFGDSITQSSRVDNGIFDETTSPFPNWPTYAKDQLQMSVFRNYAKSGAAFREYGQTNLWQMMSHQVNTAIANAETPDVIIVAMGTNDGVTANLGDYETAMGKATLTDLNRALTLEAARWAFWTIRSNFPNAVCFYANPLQRATADSTALAPLVDGLSKMALRYGFALIDQHRESGIIRDLEVGDNHLYLADGLHPNTAGRILQANYIVSKIVARMTY